MSKKDGGPAFPLIGHTESGHPCSDHDGMTLRAWLAGHIMVAGHDHVTAQCGLQLSLAQEKEAAAQARIAVLMADALIAELAKEQQP